MEKDKTQATETTESYDQTSDGLRSTGKRKRRKTLKYVETEHLRRNEGKEKDM